MTQYTRNQSMFAGHNAEEIWYRPLWAIDLRKVNGQACCFLHLKHPRFGFIDILLPWDEAANMAEALQKAEMVALGGDPQPTPTG